jgi:hypothetical protein
VHRQDRERLAAVADFDAPRWLRRAALSSAGTWSVGSGSPIVARHAAVIGAAESLAYVSVPSSVIRRTGFGFWPGNLLTRPIG